MFCARLHHKTARLGGASTAVRGTKTEATIRPRFWPRGFDPLETQNTTLGVPRMPPNPSPHHAVWVWGGVGGGGRGGGQCDAWSLRLRAAAATRAQQLASRRDAAKSKRALPPPRRPRDNLAPNTEPRLAPTPFPIQAGFCRNCPAPNSQSRDHAVRHRCRATPPKPNICAIGIAAFQLERANKNTHTRNATLPLGRVAVKMSRCRRRARVAESACATNSGKLSCHAIGRVTTRDRRAVTTARATQPHTKPLPLQGPAPSALLALTRPPRSNGFGRAVACS